MSGSPIGDSIFVNTSFTEEENHLNDLDSPDIGPPADQIENVT